MSRKDPETGTQEKTPSTVDPERQPAPRPPVPAPPRADAALTAADGLTDHADELTEIERMPLEERAAALSTIHEELASVLHEAEG
ncbi:hypothetical protein [Actinomyces sp. ZJ308]|uniref:hypothetical protein n=1 Tax=Actinomyces sp. ZJ308 TaxID=2708342 RepID=UPI00141F3EDA|nr:hypothetical protein [Actinomyces sp. ZJ308]